MYYQGKKIKVFRKWGHIPTGFTGCFFYEQGKTYYWYLNGKAHNLDGPAVLGEVYKAYYIEGKYFPSQKDFESHPDVIKHNIGKKLTIIETDEFGLTTV